MGGVVPLEVLPPDLLSRAVDQQLAETLRALTAPGTLVAAAEPKGVSEPESAVVPPVPPPTPMPHEPRVTAAEIRGRALQARVSHEQLVPGPMQGIMLVPEPLAAVLPPLEESYSNPERSVMAVDEEGMRWSWLYVHYNRSGEGRRLIGLTPFLEKHGARPGDLLRMVIGPSGMIGTRLERAPHPETGHGISGSQR